ncbi:CAAX prenyl protease-related protein [Kiritimatiella glycovorans]|uniref:CAAX prenyl protease-related protein n=1 Tax=Kiritimatiella glycovorans TaxID=1307763 RepID=A0A0G3EHZ2_9BACT|nr:CAAX prenyl protease-related protein [Kiritimatiella glycovorans]AKJ64425.1 CAAX prenyl protease-related protein [Kiritimatiella glycovorans]
MSEASRNAVPEQEWTEELKKENERAVWVHVIPFLVWITFIPLFDPSGWAYAARTVLGTAVLLACRPWRWYAPPRWRNMPLAVGIGVLVFVVWVGPESAWFTERFPALSEAYERYAVDLTRFGKLREPLERPSPYDPSVTGWPLFWAHMFGTSIAVALLEEFFWRGFLYRWMLGSPFFRIPMGRMSVGMFVAVAALFGIEHFEWAAGIACGLLFGWLVIHTRDIWAGVVAHAVTNFMLGIYVWQSGAWQFW